MGVGFAVSRFGLFLREFSAAQPMAHPNHHHPLRHHRSSVSSPRRPRQYVAVFNHLSVVKKLSTGTWQPGQPSKTAVALGLLLAILGTGMAIYLIRFR